MSLSAAIQPPYVNSRRRPRRSAIRIWLHPTTVLGVNVASRPDWGDRNTSADLFHDPFVLFGFLAGCTRNIEFSTQVLILAQRQAVLVAKQAASLDLLCGGRSVSGSGSAGTRSSSSASTRIF